MNEIKHWVALFHYITSQPNYRYQEYVIDRINWENFNKCIEKELSQ